MKKKMALAAAILFMLMALGIMLYPLISSYYNSAHQSAICVQHNQAIAKAPDTEKSKIWQAAQSYNKRLRSMTSENYDSEELNHSAKDYQTQLDLAGDGIMGYVEIPKIQVHLPIYHGTKDNTLAIGIGHLLGSSLPVGGAGTHCVLTAHSGMASQKMFSDLPQLKVGDAFCLHVLDQVLAYQVDDIRTVLPYDTSLLGFDRQHDYCTLVTCTPFGVNTHRLLVRGTRIPYREEILSQTPAALEEGKPTISTWEQEYLKGIFYGLGGVLTVLILLWGIRRWSKCHAKK